MKGGGALDFDGDALMRAQDDDDAEDALKTDVPLGRLHAIDASPLSGWLFSDFETDLDAPLKGPNGTPLSDMDAASVPRTASRAVLVRGGRARACASGPIGKTPVGGYGGPGGLSPLPPTTRPRWPRIGVAVPMSDDLALQLLGQLDQKTTSTTPT